MVESKVCANEIWVHVPIRDEKLENVAIIVDPLYNSKFFELMLYLIPAINIEDELTKMNINNYNIQYKYQDGSHVNNNINSFLKIVTDGTLYEELKNNPTLFKKFKDKYINKNIYDIIIVDEAHEHGINMDIIIALSKQSCYFNNKVKLMIVSATMDNDEPTYRSYFSHINDKLMYPIKANFSHHPITKENKYFLPEPQLMDRRYHISPPGKTTQYNIVVGKFVSKGIKVKIQGWMVIVNKRIFFIVVPKEYFKGIF